MNIRKLTEQKNLMLLAVDIAREIEVVERLFRPVDPTYTNLIVEKLTARYAEAVARLMATMPTPEMLELVDEGISKYSKAAGL